MGLAAVPTRPQPHLGLWFFGEKPLVLWGPDHRHLRLLRARRERPPGHRAAEQRDECAPAHSITSSASASTFSGPSERLGLGIC